jgi:meso-butanediol dehydrogenase/(S,S)-butanediol dehydrogenase/diacetyl reductase
MTRFAGKVVVITGAASGIGEGAVRRFAREGATLALADRDSEKLDHLATALDAKDLMAEVVDVSSHTQVKAFVEKVAQRFGRIDVVCNIAGVDHLGQVDEGDLGEWRRIMSIDLDGVFFMCRETIGHLRRSKGCIINMSSVSGIGGDWNHSFYNAAKGAVTNFTRALAMDAAAHGVRVNAVNPSYVRTPMTRGMQDQPDLIAKFEERIPLGRGGEPDDVAGVIAFLASEDARFITGVNLPVDGGLSASNGQPRLS